MLDKISSEEKDVNRPPNNSDDNYDLWLQLLYTVRALRKARTRELRNYHITPEQIGVLYAISILGEDVTLARISQWQILEPHTVSGMVSRMEKDGLVKKTKDLPNKNWVRVVLTEKGARALAQTTMRESIHRIMEPLSTEQRLQFRSCLKALQDSAPVKELWRDRLRAKRNTP